jgi:hypothetical protein
MKIPKNKMRMNIPMKKRIRMMKKRKRRKRSHPQKYNMTKKHNS